MLIYVEMLLTNINMLPHMLGIVGLWTVSYGLFAMVYYNLTGTWTYPFLRTDRWWTPLAYSGLLLGHWVFFGAAYGIVHLRNTLLRGTARSKAPTARTPMKARAVRVAHTPSKQAVQDAVQDVAHTPSRVRRAVHTPTKAGAANGSLPATPVRQSARLAAKTKSMTAA